MKRRKVWVREGEKERGSKKKNECEKRRGGEEEENIKKKKATKAGEVEQ